MLFDFQKFIGELREHDQKKVLIEKYEQHFGQVVGTLEEQKRYEEYVGTLPVTPYKVPTELQDDFHRELLMKLVAGSFSSDGLLQGEAGEIPDFVISVQSGEQRVVKKISELRGFQILRLYSIYIEEQMNLAILMQEEEKEKEAIVNQREQRKKRRQLVLDNRTSAVEKEAYEKEKEDKLGDLMNQL